jgi:exopolysaccharide production protein ExoZ
VLQQYTANRFYKIIDIVLSQESFIMLVNRWQSVQALRGLAVLGVVAFHAMIVEKKYAGGDRLLPDFFRLGQTGVDLFFVISGFVILSVTTGRFGNRREPLRFLWGRLARIYPVYWFYFFLTVPLFFIKPDWVNASQGRSQEWFFSFFLWPSDRLPLVMVAWSLIHELWFYLVFSVLLTWNERLLLPALLFWGGIVMTANIFMKTSGLSPGFRIILHPYTLEFITGALVYIFVSSEYGKSFYSKRVLPVFGVLLMLGFSLVYIFDVLKEANLLRAGALSVLYGLLLLVLAVLEREKKIRVPEFLCSIGDNSYTIYLSHVLILSAVGRLWFMVERDPNGLFDNLLMCLIMLAVTLMYGRAGYRLIERPILTFSRRLRALWFENDGRGSLNSEIGSNTLR